ncbi:MAG: hypothetical protein KatS3mg115_1359 [Candidatus Poribacteria bacterium]|nr:MAG: hypothetical protein KatS3mg115_1359 [Candidatus Poribacteria bacterium]
MAYLAIVTDEISGDPETAVELGIEWGITHFEVRSVASGRVPKVSDRDWGRLVRLGRRQEIQWTAISPGFFKVPLGDPSVQEVLKRDLDRAIQLAQEMGIPKMIFFAFRKDDRPRKEAVREASAILAECADRCAEAGLLFVLENEHVCWGDTGRHALEILEAIGRSQARLNWDPCNCVWAGGDPHEEFEAVRPRMAHLHIKDTALDRWGEFRGAPIGMGVVGWPELLPRLLRSGWNGPYTVETHYGPKVAASRECTERLRRLLVASL